MVLRLGKTSPPAIYGASDVTSMHKRPGRYYTFLSLHVDIAFH
jgi:hypothetical protein